MRAASRAEVCVRVLVVDDDPYMRESVRTVLARDGHTTLLATRGAEALVLLEQVPVEAIVLDWMMPDMDGLETCRSIRSRRSTPVVMLTARSGEADKVRILDAGADDYLTKPFGSRELLARLRAVVRRSTRSGQGTDGLLVVGDLTIDTRGGSASFGGRRAALSPTELRLLTALAITPDQPRRPRDLVRDLGFAGCAERDAQELIKVNVRRLRHKIEDDPRQPRRIVTHWGLGYALRSLDTP
jgi:DNA-binding response OmpR family regulator